MASGPRGMVHEGIGYRRANQETLSWVSRATLDGSTDAELTLYPPMLASHRVKSRGWVQHDLPSKPRDAVLNGPGGNRVVQERPLKHRALWRSGELRVVPVLPTIKPRSDKSSNPKQQQTEPPGRSA